MEHDQHIKVGDKLGSGKIDGVDALLDGTSKVWKAEGRADANAPSAVGISKNRAYVSGRAVQHPRLDQAVLGTHSVLPATELAVVNDDQEGIGGIGSLQEFVPGKQLGDVLKEMKSGDEGEQTRARSWAIPMSYATCAICNWSIS